MNRRFQIMMTLALASALTFSTLTVDAASYKLSSNKLVNAQTGKTAKGYITYNKKLYKNGKIFSGIYSDKLYKNGKVDKKNYYVTGSTLYKNGRIVYSLVLYNGVLYNSSMRAVGKIVYDNKLYVNGKIKEGIVLSSNKQLYEKVLRFIRTVFILMVYFMEIRLSLIASFLSRVI